MQAILNLDPGDSSLLKKIRQLLVVFLESDFTLKNKVDWDTFSYAVQSTRKRPSNHLTLYHPR